MREARGRLEIAVQHKRIEVGAIGPYDRAELIIHTDLGKELGVCQGLEHRTA